MEIPIQLSYQAYIMPGRTDYLVNLYGDEDIL